MTMEVQFFFNSDSSLFSISNKLSHERSSVANKWPQIPMDLVENGDLSIIELKLEPLNAAILLIILLGKTGMV